MDKKDVIPKIRKLANLMAEDIASEADILKLNDLLKNHSMARREYLKYMDLHSLLAVDFSFKEAADQSELRITKSTPKQAESLSDSSRELLSDDDCEPSTFPIFLTHPVKHVGDFISKPTPLSIALAFIVILSILATLALITTNKQVPSVADNLPGNELLETVRVATISEMKDCKFDSSSNNLRIGSRLRETQQIKIKSGLIVITFDSGATTVVQGPATFKILSKNAAELSLGKITAEVNTPESHGFVVETSLAKIVDLGTKFGVSVDESETTLLQVKQGQVEFSPKENADLKQKQIVKAGEAVRIVRGQKVVRVPLDNESFVWIENELSNGHIRWQRYSNNLRKDPSLLVYYTFDNFRTSPESLLNLAIVTQGRLEGTLGDGENAKTSPHWSSGRWDLKGALSFRSSQQQRVIVPDWKELGFDKAFTVSAWVRLKHKRPKQTIVSDFNKSLPNFLHVSIFKSGIRFSTYSEDRSNRKREVSIQNPTPHTEVGANRWHHVVCTCRASGGAKKMYVDGVEVYGQDSSYRNSEFPKFKSPLVIGGKHQGGSCFDGAIDELAIFNRELSGLEIKEMYQVGKPSVKAN